MPAPQFSHPIIGVAPSQTTAVDAFEAAIQAVIDPTWQNIEDHKARTDNPHATTKAQVGLGNVDNTSDLNKPISIATQAALDGKAAAVHSHSIADVTGLQSTLDGKASAATVAAIQAGDATAYRLVSEASREHRPGNNPRGFSFTGAHSLAQGADGWAVRFSGVGTVTSTMRVPIEAGRLYQVRGAWRRNSNGPDPAGDAVRLEVIWYSATGAQLSSAVVHDDVGCTVAAGRRIFEALLARPGVSGASIISPDGTREAAVRVTSYGTGHTLDVELLQIVPLTVAQVIAGPAGPPGPPFDGGFYESRAAAEQSLHPAGSTRLSYRHGDRWLHFVEVAGATALQTRDVSMPQRTNRFLRSNEVNDSAWARVGFRAFGSGSVANSTANPLNGAITADTLVEDDGTSTRAIEQARTCVAWEPQTVSWYVKATGNGAPRIVGLSLSEFGDPNKWVTARFDIATGQVVATNVVGDGYSLTDSGAVITNAGSGWYRISLSGVTGAATNVVGRLYLATDATTFSANGRGAQVYVGNNTSGVIVWGAQLENGDSVSPFILTTTTEVTRPEGVRTWAPADIVTQLHWGGSDAAAMQGAIDWVLSRGGGDITVIGTVEHDDTVYIYHGVNLIYAENGTIKRPDASPGYILLALGNEGSGLRIVNPILDNNWAAQGTVPKPGSDPDGPAGVQHNIIALYSASNSGPSGLEPNSTNWVIESPSATNWGPYANAIKMFGCSEARLTHPYGRNGGSDLWHYLYARRVRNFSVHGGVLRDMGSQGLRVSGLNDRSGLVVTNALIDGCGRGIAAFDISDVSITGCVVKNAIYGAANGIAIVSSNPARRVTLSGTTVHRAGQYGVNLTNLREFSGVGLTISDCGRAGIYGRNLRRCVFDGIQITFENLANLRRPPDGNGNFQTWLATDNPAPTLATPNQLTVAAFLFDATGVSAQQIRIGDAVQCYHAAGAAASYGLELRLPNGQIDIPDDWETRCVGFTRALEDPNDIARRPTTRINGDKWEVIRRPDGTQTTLWRIDMGAMGALGAGTATDPYRTASFTGNWPGSLPFRTWPSGLSLTPVVRSSTAIERIVSAGLRRATESQLVQAQVAGLAGSSAGTANVGLIVEANGIWRWRTQQPLRHDYAAGRYSIDGAPVPFAPADWQPGAVAHTRASAGLYLDNNGMFQSAATDVARFDHSGGTLRTNRAQYSADTTNPWWGKARLVAGGLYADENGEMNLRFWRENTETGSHAVARDNITIAASQPQTISVVFRSVSAGNARRLTLALSGPDNDKWIAARFSPTEGGAIVTNAVGNGFALSGDGARIQSLGNGLFRAILSGVIGSETSLFVRIALSPVPSDLVAEGDVTTGTEVWSPTLRGQQSYAGDGVSGLAIGNIQIESGNVATRLIPTAGSEVSVWGTRALLLEPAATYLNTRNAEPNNAAWSKVGLRPFTGAPDSVIGAVASPIAGVNADLLVENDSTGVHRITQSVTFTAGANIPVSALVKRASGTRDLRVILDNGGDTVNVVFDLTARTGSGGSTGTGSLISGRTFVVPLPDDWLWCGFVANMGGSITTANVRFGLNTGNGSYTGDNTSGLYLVPLGAATGDFVTSPVVTSASQVTRAADVATIAAVRDSLRIDLTHGGDIPESLGIVALNATDLAAMAKGEHRYRLLELKGSISA
jgi:hypothetical protein